MMKAILVFIFFMIVAACSPSSEYDHLIRDRYEGVEYQNITLDKNAPSTIKQAIKNDEVYFLVFETKGFHEGLVLGIEIDKQSRMISDVFIIAHQETPDYGGVIDEGWFTDRYHNQSINLKTKVVRWISKSDDEIVAMTGATITSNAVNSIINQAKDYIHEIEE